MWLDISLFGSSLSLRWTCWQIGLEWSLAFTPVWILVAVHFASLVDHKDWVVYIQLYLGYMRRLFFSSLWYFLIHVSLEFDHLLVLPQLLLDLWLGQLLIAHNTLFRSHVVWVIAIFIFEFGGQQLGCSLFNQVVRFELHAWTWQQILLNFFLQKLWLLPHFLVQSLHYDLHTLFTDIWFQRINHAAFRLSYFLPLD